MDNGDVCSPPKSKKKADVFSLDPPQNPHIRCFVYPSGYIINHIEADKGAYVSFVAKVDSSTKFITLKINAFIKVLYKIVILC